MMLCGNKFLCAGFIDFALIHETLSVKEIIAPRYRLRVIKENLM